jgi:hypothetical protein
MFGGRNKYTKQRFDYTRNENYTTDFQPTDQDEQRKKANQVEIDRILDKIRKSGYDSLSKEEKQTLFDQSNK